MCLERRLSIFSEKVPDLFSFLLARLWRDPFSFQCQNKVSELRNLLRNRKEISISKKLLIK
ncbi:hypothetical protein A2772_03100 [Candidatus Daviesbacteria bacterium RIFCSPHIGHO2_01_FULL_38_8b]|nr:MAG: hypothetical protein A2772_03100 [Candidatus Daviesbacteria bacterium RIFCSPHIGHO2_01_FULL_38_8b]